MEWRGRKRGLELERTKSSVASSLARKKAKKNFYNREKLHDSPSSGSLGDSSDKQSTSGEEEVQEAVVYKEPSMYDNLLRTLGSGSESLANVYKRLWLSSLFFPPNRILKSKGTDGSEWKIHK